ncbi:MAG: PDZ domain-containing protein [Planctomycetales bacterium]|nr:PDZ domain-containing protein [Planctomycetales bacterium]
MISRFLSGSAATFFFLSAAVLAQPPITEPSPTDADSPPVVADVQPELMIKPVPPILRLHLPTLGPDLGVLVESVASGSAAEKAGLRSGDVLIEAGGHRVVAGVSMATPDAAVPMVVIRRGQIQVLHAGIPRHEFYDRFDDFAAPGPMMNAPMFNGPPVGFENNRFQSHGRSVTSSASSSSSGNRAVSISRAGDQISLEMSLPGLAEGTIRLRGTAAEIDQQLETSPHSEAAKREVRAALRQAR